MRSNVHVWLECAGQERAGSRREGHNVFTNFGRQWLSQVSAWSVIGVSSDDVPFTNQRVRWIAVGDGSQAELVGVTRLVSALSVTTGPDVYLRELPTPSFPTSFSVRWDVVFPGVSSDFDHHGDPVSVSEVALFIDEDTGGGPSLNVGDPNLEPIAYKTFSPLSKGVGDTLFVTWEFRF